MRWAAVVFAAAGAACAHAQATHNGYIWIEGPEEVLAPETTYTLEVWGRWESPLWVDGVSAIYGFGLDVFNTDGAASIGSVSNVAVEPWAHTLVSEGSVVGNDILLVSGAQMPPDFPQGPPDIEYGNPLRLFTFDVTTGAVVVGRIGFEPSAPEFGAFAFYPDALILDRVFAGAPDTALHLSGWRSVPGPGGAAVIAAAMVWRRRR